MFRMQTVVPSLLLFVAMSGVAAAQGDGHKPPSSKRATVPSGKTGAAVPKRTSDERKGYEQRKKEIRKRIQTYRAQMRAGTVLRTHVKVRVRLRNGELMVGVVKDGLFVERPAGLEFVRAEMTAKGAGLRLWYYNDTSGYIFLPYTMIKTYKVLRRLSDVQIKEIRDKILERERAARSRGEKRRKELANKQQELRKGVGSAAKAERLAKKLADEEKKTAGNAKLMKLLKEFPPSEGWGADKIKAINLRRLTIRVYPNPKERRFIEKFDEWKLATKLIEKKKGDGAKKAAGQEGKGTPQPKPGGGRD